MGQIHRWLGLGRADHPGGSRHRRREAPAATRRHHLRHQQRVRLRLPARQHGALKDDKVQRGHNYCIVDEVDSILIDEARTPLIISGRVGDAAKLYYRFASIVRSLKARRRLRGRRGQAASSSHRGRHREGRAALGVENLYDNVQANLVHQFTVALKAKELYKRDKDYIVQGGEVKIVDEFTGRILEGRRWSEGSTRRSRPRKA
jgi:preprotein translocase subunit SecA